MYDVIIIGAGPAGLTAALYASRSNLKTLILERGIYGGLMQQTDEIENYPAFKMIKGPELSQLMYEQAVSFGATYAYGDVKSIEVDGHKKIVKTSNGVFEAYSVILATGANPKKLGIKGEEELGGRGVSYCAICDGAFFRNKEIVVIGGGDSAVEEANFLTKYASKVTILHRRDSFRAQAILQERVFSNPKINIKYNVETLEILGENGKVSGVSYLNKENMVEEIIACEGAFIYVGMKPNTDPFRDLPVLNEEGYVQTIAGLETAVSGIFVAGDMREKRLRQIITAAGDGSEAAIQAHHYIEKTQQKNILN